MSIRLVEQALKTGRARIYSGADDARGIDYTYYQRIEYGEKNLSLRVLYKTVRAFEMTTSELVDIE